MAGSRGSRRGDRHRCHIELLECNSWGCIVVYMMIQKADAMRCESLQRLHQSHLEVLLLRFNIQLRLHIINVSTKIKNHAAKR